MDGKDDEGELVFLPNQLNQIVNLDESGLTLDSCFFLAGGQASTRYGPASKNIACGADCTNKSSS